MRLAALNESGLSEFRGFLQRCRQGSDEPAPSHLLTDPKATRRIEPEIQAPNKTFALRRDAADFLSQTFGSQPTENIAHDDGLWSWLSLRYFDSLCSVNQGRRVVRNDYQYVFEHANARHWYRHLLYISWHIRRIARGYDRLYMGVPVNRLDSVTEDTLKRLFLTRIPCMFEALELLYWDESRGRVRPGVAGPRVRAGDLTNRLPIRIRQLALTYDLHSLDARQLLKLLEPEFRAPASRQLKFESAAD